MKINLLTLFFILCFGLTQSQVEYKDVAGIFHAKCASCHHPGGAAPNPFLYYTETASYAGSIQNDLINGKMPPWNADTAYTRFQHERIISYSEKQKILNWIAGGALQGDTTQAPTPPVFPTGYQLAGNADLTLSIGTFTSNATTVDAYNCFALPSGLTQDRIIKAFEIIPGNASIVHHAVVTADTTGTYTSDLSGGCYNIPGNLAIGTYAPGTKATVFPSQSPLMAGMRLKAGSTVIVQIHNPAGSAGEVDSTKIRIYFYPVGTTGVRTIYSSTPLQNWSMSIPANSTRTYTAYYPSASSSLPVSLSAFAVMPHSHLICKTILYYAVKPGIDTIPLVKIKDWNFEWQDYYTFNNLVKIPVGYKLFSKHVYDNTASNPNNPNSPPITVNAGTGTHDEMLFDGLMYLYYQAGDENIDVKSIMDNDPIYVTGVNEKQKDYFQLNARILPNPFTEMVTIQYTLNEASSIQIELTDIFGRTIQSYNLGKQAPGSHAVEWKGDDVNGNKIPSGMYFYKIRSEGKTLEGKMIRQN